MNKYEVLGVCLFLVVMLLLFSGFIHSSVFHWFISMGILFFSVHLLLKGHLVKRPDLTPMKKYAYGFLIFGFTVASVISVVFTNNPPKNSALMAKLIVTGFNSLVTFLVIAKLFLHWHKLNTTFIVTSFIAIFVLVSSILFFWVFI